MTTASHASSRSGPPSTSSKLVTIPREPLRGDQPHDHLGERAQGAPRGRAETWRRGGHRLRERLSCVSMPSSPSTALFDAFPGLRARIPWMALGRFPTRVHRLAGLAPPAVELWVKR